MTVGIIVAMNEEYNLIRDFLTKKKLTTYTGRKNAYLSGEVGNISVILVQSGIGKVNAAQAVTELICTYDVDAIISQGVAGSLGEAKTGDVIASTACQYWDVWCGKPNSKGQVQGMPVAFASSADLFQKVLNIKGVKAGVIVSGDTFIDNAKAKAKICKEYVGAKAVDMESAAIAQVCHIYDKPFLALRVISDGCDQEDYAAYWMNLAKDSFNAVSLILKSL